VLELAGGSQPEAVPPTIRPLARASP
jgi:hypothetical protein